MKLEPFNKLCLLFSFLCFAYTSLQAQEAIFLEGIVLDSKNGEPLEKVTIFNQSNNSGTYSELDGKFKIELNDLPTKIIFSYIGYENFLLEINSEPKVPIEIQLKRSNIGLPEIEVTDQPRIEKLSRKKYSIKDFIFDRENILLLAHGDIFTGNILVLKNWEGDVLFELKLPRKLKAQRLHRSCLGNIHLVGKTSNYEIGLIANQIQLISQYPNREFEKMIVPCISASNRHVYFRQYAMKNQALSYLIFSKKDHDLIRRIMVVDEENIDRMKDDFQLKIQSMKSNPNERPLTWEQMMAWESIMYPPIYSPLINFGKEIGVFNHLSGFIEFYNLEGISQRYIPISYHQNKKWDHKILFDEKKKTTYVVFNTKKGKSIYKLDLSDGTIHPVLFFDCNFVEKMVVHNDHFFYLESGITNDKRNRILHRIELN